MNRRYRRDSRRSHDARRVIGIQKPFAPNVVLVAMELATEKLMVSPFPGMDPYLEGGLWTTLHIQLAVEIARQLTPRILPRYFAFANQRQVTDLPEEVAIEAGDVYPDVVPHSWVEIRDQAGRTLVTLIEILSPTNKRGDGRREYLRKRKIALANPLPTVRIPLREPDADLPLDLQQAFTNIYEQSPYGVAIDYFKPPDVPLTKAAADWAAERIKRARNHRD